ncbi:type II toxin-antitoxin system RelE/ParE family toxin [Occallatibacter savannae]|uniref:type II toxin-antitoxin system RelE/ParE family toxin n=1 Tax=Occallatibacter savannae TaxID=1002691 RepID=UPI0019516753
MARFIRQESISLEALVHAIGRAESGLVDAELGGGLIKQRVPRKGQGRSGGYRTIIAYRQGTRAVFLYGFAKSRWGNIAMDELKTVRQIAARFLSFTEQELQLACEKGEIEEIIDAG